MPFVTMTLGIALAVIASQAVANSAAFSFVMERRAVHGKRNGKLHALDAGELTLNGGVWVVSKAVGASSSPVSVEIVVYKEPETKVCSAVVTPSKIFNDKRSATTSCGRVDAGNYWIFAVKDDVDGWHVKGSGTMDTK